MGERINDNNKFLNSEIQRVGDLLECKVKLNLVLKEFVVGRVIILVF